MTGKYKIVSLLYNISRCAFVRTFSLRLNDVQRQSCPPPDGRWGSGKPSKKGCLMKKQRIEFRVSSLEKAIISKKSEHSGLSVSDYCRRSALQQNISYKLTTEEIEIYKMLVQYRNNFASIGNLFKNNEPISEELKKLIHQLDEHLKKMQ